MRRFSPVACITLLSLMLSGWGSVLAAAFCPHMALEHAQARSEVPECCRAKMGKPGASEHDAHHKAGHGVMTRPASRTHLHGQAAAAFQLPGNCGHCAGQGNAPATAEPRELSLKKRDTTARMAHAHAAPGPVISLHAPRFKATQHAPPGTPNRRHLLLSVFLI